MAFMNRPIIAVDFDGTIRQGKRYLSKNNRLMPFCKWVIKKLHSRGCRFILWTCRGDGIDLEFAKKILADNGILYCFEAFNENIKEITWNCRKVYGDYYVDDLNLGGFPGWMKVFGVVMCDDYFRKERK